MGLITGGGPYNGFIRPGPYINQNFQFFETWVDLTSNRKPRPYMRGNLVCPKLQYIPLAPCIKCLHIFTNQFLRFWGIPQNEKK